MQDSRRGRKGRVCLPCVPAFLHHPGQVRPRPRSRTGCFPHQRLSRASRVSSLSSGDTCDLLSTPGSGCERSTARCADPAATPLPAFPITSSARTTGPNLWSPVGVCVSVGTVPARPQAWGCSRAGGLLGVHLSQARALLWVAEEHPKIQRVCVFNPCLSDA